MGTPFMPWQQLVADVGGEYDPTTGRPYYREVVVTIPRQGGKTTVTLGFELQRCLGWGKRQMVAYTAQDGFAARKKLLDEQVPMLESSALWKAVRRVKRSNGDEGIVFTNGSQVTILGSSPSAGHGRSFDLAVIDEAMNDTDERREQSLRPTMITKPDAQLLVVSTAGTEASLYLKRKVAVGREAAHADKGSGIAYFEWSAPDDMDPDDPATWWSCHPALGHTISEEVIAHERATMTDGEFRRAYLNQWTETDERIIPVDVWDLVCAPDVAPSGEVMFGLEVNEQRSSASIVAVSKTGEAEVIEQRDGVGWVLDWVKEKPSRARSSWAVDGAKSAPVASLVPDLTELVDRVVPVKEVAAACGSFYDAVAERTVSIRRHPALDAAVAGAQRKLVADGWMFSRRSPADVSPLLAVTIARWAALQVVAVAEADFFTI